MELQWPEFLITRTFQCTRQLINNQWTSCARDVKKYLYIKYAYQISIVPLRFIYIRDSHRGRESLYGSRDALPIPPSINFFCTNRHIGKVHGTAASSEVPVVVRHSTWLRMLVQCAVWVYMCEIGRVTQSWPSSCDKLLKQRSIIVITMAI